MRKMTKSVKKITKQIVLKTPMSLSTQQMWYKWKAMVKGITLVPILVDLGRSIKKYEIKITITITLTKIEWREKIKALVKKWIEEIGQNFNCHKVWRLRYSTFQ